MMKLPQRKLTPLEERLIDIVLVLVERKKEPGLAAARTALESTLIHFQEVAGSQPVEGQPLQEAYKGLEKAENQYWNALQQERSQAMHTLLFLGERFGFRAGATYAAELYAKGAPNTEAWSELLGAMADDKQTDRLVVRCLRQYYETFQTMIENPQ